MQELLKSFPVVAKIPVRWGDMDSFQHVNNVSYFRYFESARIQYFEAIGFMDIVEQLGIGPILGSTSCFYRTPLTYPDIVYAGAKITEMHEKRFTMEYLIVSEHYRETAAEGTGVIICYNYQNNQTTQIPEIVHQAIEKLEGREF
ncbi:MAG: thioesterase family protein [SAR324 cluster bacterium]|nr:thioesterase family protein [SAR324 cluster bacterium]